MLNCTVQTVGNLSPVLHHDQIAAVLWMRGVFKRRMTSGQTGKTAPDLALAGTQLFVSYIRNCIFSCVNLRRRVNINSVAEQAPQN